MGSRDGRSGWGRSGEGAGRLRGTGVGRWWRVAGLTALILVVAGGALIVRDRRSTPEPPVFCAGVGMAGPVAPTPDEALRRWL
ncbi:MAG: hypothetical protein ABI251_05055, partial [Mycobacteriaceae bacterium]